MPEKQLAELKRLLAGAPVAGAHAWVGKARPGAMRGGRG